MLFVNMVVKLLQKEDVTNRTARAVLELNKSTSESFMSDQISAAGCPRRPTKGC
jgi:hypothetical protein